MVPAPAPFRLTLVPPHQYIIWVFYNLAALNDVWNFFRWPATLQLLPRNWRWDQRPMKDREVVVLLHSGNIILVYRGATRAVGKVLTDERQQHWLVNSACSKPTLTNTSSVKDWQLTCQPATTLWKRRPVLLVCNHIERYPATPRCSSFFDFGDARTLSSTLKLDARALTDGDLSVKVVFSWYDNEIGYLTKLLDSSTWSLTY